MKRSIRHLQTRVPLWQAGLLLCVLLAAQLLALVHRVEHAPGLMSLALAAPDGQTGHWQGHSAGGDSCLLLDHLGLADALHSAAHALPSTPPVAAVPVQRLRSVGFRPAPAVFLARAPPSA